MIYSLFRSRGPLFLPTVGLRNGLKMGNTRFSWRYLAFLAVQLSIIFHKVSGKGLFQLRLLSFTNDLGLDINGNCCDGSAYRTDRQCSTPCRTYFKICLFQYMTEINTEQFPKCTYGNSTTNILGNDTFQIPLNGSEGLIQLPFDYAWPSDFSLIVDALHTNMSSARNTAQVETNSRLLTRLVTQRSQTVNPTWFNDSYTTDDHSLQYSYRVICDVNFYGSRCTRKCLPRDDITGHYSCLPDGSRQCLPGWSGNRCTTPVCSNCVHGRCTGPDTCQCNAGYRGDHCDECSTKVGCEHGTCEEPNQCICNPGWAGPLCSIDTNYCTKHQPCQNGGTCLNEGPVGYRCYCSEGFTGENCEQVFIGPQCFNGGTPVSSANPPSCICPPHTTGDQCQEFVPTCQPATCSNGGSCIDTTDGFSCQCAAGFTGDHCQTRDHCISNPCENGGTCRNLMNGFSCDCSTGYVGSTCHTDICENHHCYNGGSCIADFEGARCECPSGFEGEQCGDVVDHCEGNQCQNGGSCRNLLNGYTCDCLDGYFGTMCENRIECWVNPCENGGTCVRDVVGGFTCICAERFSGMVCEEDLMSVDSTEAFDSQSSTINKEIPVEPSTGQGGMSELMQIIKMIAFVVFGVLILLSLSCLTIVIYRKQRTERTSRDLESNPAPPNNHAVLTYTDNFSNSEKVLPLLSISEKVCNKEIEQDNLKATHFKDFSSSNQLNKNSISKDYKIKDYSSSKEFECLQSSGETRSSEEDCSIVRYEPQPRYSLPRNCDSEDTCNSDEFYYYDEKNVALKRTDSLQTNSQSSSLESTPKHTAKCPILQISVEDNFPAQVALHATEV